MESHELDRPTPPPVTTPTSRTNASPSVHSKSARVLACVLCQHRKIKCDRTTPCSNCVRAGVRCTPSTPAPARKRRRPNQDLQERLARCEALIKQYASAPGAPDIAMPHAGSAAGSPSPTTPTQTVHSPVASSSGESPYLKWRPAGKVTSGDGTSKFVDSHLWANLHNELKAMKTILDEDDPEESPLASQIYTPNDIEDLMLYGSPAESVDDFHPEPVHIFRLWQIYIDRVNPLNKVIHVPSVQPYMVEAATNPGSVSPRIHALLFAIYSLASVAMEESECQQILGFSRDAAVTRFSEGAKAALAKSNFLRSFDMHTVQALCIHHMALQHRHSRDSMWIIHGIVLRLAQKLGFHRDGEALGLSPFETEMQRRIWWAIVMQDAKLSIQSGISIDHLGKTWDTKIPLNINDADMFPGAAEPLRARDGPTEMAFCLLTYRMHRFMVDNYSIPAYESVLLGQQPPPGNETAEEFLNKHRAQMMMVNEDLKEIEEKYVDPTAGPIHVMAKMFRPMVMEKIRSVMAPMREQPEWGTEILSPRDSLFKMMVTSAQQSFAYYDTVSDLGFLWYMKMHVQLDLFAVILGQLCKRVRGSLVDRAWEMVDNMYHYHMEVRDMSHRNSVVLGTFALKAWKARENALRQSGLPVVVPECITMLRDTMPANQGTPMSEMMALCGTRPSTAVTIGGGGSGSNGNSSGAGGSSARAGSGSFSRSMSSGPATDGLGSPEMGTMGPPAPLQEPKADPGLDEILNDSWSMAGLDWDIWADHSLAAPVQGTQGGQILMQQPRFPNFGGTSNGFGW